MTKTEKDKRGKTVAQMAATIRFSKKRFNQLDRIAEHYRWSRSQAIAELIDFYLRTEKAFEGFKFYRDSEGRTGVIEEDEVQCYDYGVCGHCGEESPAGSVLAWAVENMNKGLLSAFREPLEMEEAREVVTDEPVKD